MERYYLRIGETIATLISEPEYHSIAEHAVRFARRQVIDYIEKVPEFKTSYAPLEIKDNAPDIVQSMGRAAFKTNVGPMAAVAGAIAQFAIESMMDAGASHVVFDNGGDIAMYLDHPIIVGLYTGTKGPQGLGFKVTRTGTLLGLCTSSATIGHSFSFGNTDSSTVYATDVALADAYATALGNAVTIPDYTLIESSLRGVMIPGILGAMVTIDDAVGTCGMLPELVQARVDYDLISKGLGGYE
ncbi:MAG: UPF0280 family protein [Candidatus Thorarchaeota archaeon]|nr:UPF0280 family protein [Candidatus Thorarchaeota archaeon]